MKTIKLKKNPNKISKKGENKNKNSKNRINEKIKKILKIKSNEK